MKTIFFFSLLLQMNFVQSQSGSLRGVVVDQNNEPLPFVIVKVYSSDENATVITAVESDFDGMFLITNLNVGIYDIELSDFIVSMDTMRIVNLEILPDIITSLDTVELKQSDIMICCPGSCYPSSIKQKIDPFGRSITIESEDIRMR